MPYRKHKVIIPDIWYKIHVNDIVIRYCNCHTQDHKHAQDQNTSSTCSHYKLGTVITAAFVWLILMAFTKKIELCHESFMSHQ